MRIRAAAQGDVTTVRALVSHDMESGQRKDAAGNTVPAWYIQNINAVVNGKTVMNAYWGTSVSKNPFVQFSFKGAKSGDKLVMSWIDNKGEKRSDEATIA
jgi:sulfur-oxidizing protein SoxZ